MDKTDKPADAVTLLPCPFCGGGAVMRQDDDPGYPYYVTFNHVDDCPMYAVPTDMFPSFSTEAEAITAWNTRQASVAQHEAERGEVVIEGLDRSPAQFFFEVGFGSCWAEAFVRNGEKPPFGLTDEIVTRAWEIAPEAHEDAQEFDRYLALANPATRDAASAETLGVGRGEAVNWSAPLEAVNRKSGKVRAIKKPIHDYNEKYGAEGGFAVDDHFIGCLNCFGPDGKSEDPDQCDWDIRNTRPEQFAESAKGSRVDVVGEDEVHAAAARIAASQGLKWDEVCGYERPEPDNEGCGSSTCVAAHFEDHDPAWARHVYLEMARAALNEQPDGEEV